MVIYLVFSDHADYTVTEYGYFSSREKALAWIDAAGAKIRADFKDEFIRIAEIKVDEPLPRCGR